MEDKQKDKVILFHTDSCNKCPEAVELVEEIANEMTIDKLYFGKFNIAKNEGTQLTKIPSLVFFPAETPDKMDYY